MEIKLEDWIIEADITCMQKAMESGDINSEDLVNVYLDRIRKYDTAIKSIIEINPDAIEIARALDKERQESGSRGPLHGIPIFLKDNIDTHDKLHTSAGALALAESIADQDSFVASQLRLAGAIILGKSNMTEWANHMSPTMWAGYSARGGLTLNPYGPSELFVGGSSSGSAAAVAANLGAAAIGTETAGSIVCPASQNFVVGLKPTVGLISRNGIIPLTYTHDTAGPMTRSVADTAIILGALTGVDERDPMTLPSKNRSYRDYTPFLDASYLKKARIGIPRFYYQDLDEERLAFMESAIQTLQNEGATIIDSVTLPCQDVEWSYAVFVYEFKKYVNDYLAKCDDSLPAHSLQEVIAFNEQHAEIALKYGQNKLIRSEQTSGTLTEQVYLDALKQNKEFAREQGIDYVLQKYQLDALLLPGNYMGSDLAARAGYPIITVPAGYAAKGTTTSEGWITKGPFGVIFSGTAFSEPTLIKIAYGFEQATRHRHPPF